jgi:hypothetical protein
VHLGLKAATVMRWRSMPSRCWKSVLLSVLEER